MTSAKLDASSYRWLSALSTFSFTIQYRPGKCNLDADGLSKCPHGMLTNDRVSQKEQGRIDQFTLHHSHEESDSISVPTDVVQALSDRHLVHSDEDSNYLPLIESLSVSSNIILETYECLEGLPVVPQLTVQELKDKQRTYKAIKEVILQLESGKLSLHVLRKELREFPFLL